MSTVNAVTIFAENLQGANLVVGNTTSNLTVTANSIAISIGNVTINSTAINVVSPISATQNTTINATSLTANTLKLNGTDYNGVVGDTVLVDYQVFTNPLVANYWYKPAWVQDNDIVTIMMWGGGGGSAFNTLAGIGGGGGGACVIVNKLVGECDSVCNVVVGAGGIGSSTNAVSGNPGGNSVFWTNSTFSITAYGGGAAFANASAVSGGGGGGWFDRKTFNTGGDPLGGNSTVTSSTFGGGFGGGTVAAGDSVYGGGGGATAIFTTAGKSIYGGGGGACSSPGGTSTFGGAGGNSSVAPQAPGGGGGVGGSGGFGPNGARGEVRVWVTGQARAAGDALPYYFMTPNTSILFEGNPIKFDVTTINVADGTTLYYTLNNSSTAVASDFVGLVNGSIIINGGANSFTLNSNTDGNATETFYMDLRTSSSTGTIVANSSIVTIPSPVTLINRSTVSSSTSNLSTYTFTDVPVGTASSTRRVIAVLTADDGSATGRTLSSATIGGIDATIDIQVTNSTGGSGVVAIVSATVPTGTTATVVANYSGGLARATCWVVAIDNLQSVTPYDTLTDITSPLSGAIDWAKGGFVVAGGSVNSDAATLSWTGINEQYETDYGTASAGGGDLLPTADGKNQTVAMTVSGGTATRFSMAAVSYR